MSTPFGPNRTMKTGIPGVGDDPQSKKAVPSVVFPEMWDLFPDVEQPQQLGPPPPGQELAPAPVAEPEPDFEPAPDFTDPSQVRFPTMDEIFAGAITPYNPFKGQPFERQKLQLRTLGAEPERIRQLDVVTETLMGMPEQKRIREFNANQGYFDSLGMSPEEMAYAKDYFGLTNIKEQYNIFERAARGIKRGGEATGILWKEGELEEHRELKRKMMESQEEFLRKIVTHPEDVGAAMKLFGKTLVKVPKQTAASIVTATQGWRGASVVNKGWADRLVESAHEDVDKFAQETAQRYGDRTLFPGVPLTELAKLSGNIGFSITSAGAGLAVGVPISFAPVPGARAGAYVAGGAAAGVTAFNMASYEVMQEYLEAMNETFQEREGRDMTIEEENILKQGFANDARKYGLWEAIPEAIGGPVAFGLLIKPLNKVAGKVVATRILARFAGIYGEELFTETITEMGQARIRKGAGLPGAKDVDWTSPTDWLNSLKAVAPQTFLLTTVMGGGVGGASLIRTQVQQLKEEIGEGHPLYRVLAQKMAESVKSRAGEVIKEVKGAFQHYTYPTFYRTSPVESQKIMDRRRSAEPILGVEYYRDMIRNRNWQGVLEEASMGRFPDMEEMGYDWLENEIRNAKTEAGETERRVLENVMAYATTHPSASWYRNATAPETMSLKAIASWKARYGQNLDDISVTKKDPFIAPNEGTPTIYADPANTRDLLIFGADNQTVANHATPGFVSWSRSQGWLPINIQQAWNKYSEGKDIQFPMGKDTISDFANSITPDDIADQLPVGFDARVAAANVKVQLNNLHQDNVQNTHQLLHSTDGNVHVMLPKTEAATRRLFQTVRGTPTATQIAGLLPPPPVGGSEALSEDIGTQFRTPLVPEGEGAMPTVPDSQRGVAPVGVPRADVVSLAAETRQTPQEIEFLRAQGLPDTAIRGMAQQNLERLPGITAAPEVGDRVIVPKLGWREGILSRTEVTPAPGQVQQELPPIPGTEVPPGYGTTFQQPAGANVEISFYVPGPGGLSTRHSIEVPRADVYKADALKFGEIVPEPMEGSLEEADRIVSELQQGEMPSAEELSRNPGIAERYGLEEQSMMIREQEKQRQVERVKAIHEESKRATPSNPMPEPLSPATEPAVPQYIQDELEVSTPRETSQVPEVPDQQPLTEVADPALNIAVPPGAEEVPTQQVFEDAPPTDWTMRDGRPIWNVPLNEYLGQGESPEHEAVRRMKETIFGTPGMVPDFNMVRQKTGDRYVREVGKVVKTHIPEAMPEYEKLRSQHERTYGSVPVSKFDLLISREHQLYARMQFRNEILATGDPDGLMAASKIHRQEVRKAAVRGEAIREDVLDHYPDIRKMLTETDAVVSTPTKALNDDLQSRGYTYSQVSRMSPQSKEWIANNNIDPKEISILTNGQVVQMTSDMWPRNDPRAYRGINTPEGINELVDNEKGRIDRIIEQIKESDPEAGFFRIPGGEAILRFKVTASRLTESWNHIFESRVPDVIRDLEGAIDKWAAEYKRAEVHGEQWEHKLRAIVETSIEEHWSKKIKTAVKERRISRERRFKTPTEELHMVTKWHGEPDYYQAEYEKLSPQAKLLAQVIKEDYQERRDHLMELGLMKEFVENYTHRLYFDSPDKIDKILYGATRAQIKAKSRITSKRKYATEREAEAAGLHPNYDPFIRHRTYVEEYTKLIARNNLVNTLMELQTEDGTPVVLAKQPVNSPYYTAYEKEYVPMGKGGVEQLVYVNTLGKTPIFLRVPARTTPATAKRLSEVFGRYDPPGRWYKNFLAVKSMVMRYKMINVAIHAWSFMSDYMTEYNFNFYKAGKGLVSARRAYWDMDPRVDQFVRGGLSVTTSRKYDNDLRVVMGQQVEWLKNAPNVIGIPAYPVRKFFEYTDKALWGFCRMCQIGMCEVLTQKLQKHNPTWTEEEAIKVAAHYSNKNQGMFPRHWIKPRARAIAEIALFAPRWTISNLDMLVTAATKGKYGLGLKGMNQEQRYEMGRHLGLHIAKMSMGLLIYGSMMQMGIMAITNLFKDKGWMKGAKVKVRPMFMNPGRHRLDIWYGTDEQGRAKYMAGHFFRSIRDYVGWGRHPTTTLMNKADVFTKIALEQVFNYQAWNEQPIRERGAPAIEHVKAGMRHFAGSILSTSVWQSSKGRIVTTTDRIVAASGTWIKRGQPGGKMGEYYFNWRAFEDWRDNKLTKEMKESIRNDEHTEAFKDAIKLYKDPIKGLTKQYLREAAPFIYRMSEMSQNELLEFNQFLKREGKSPFKQTFTLKEVGEAMAWEAENLQAQSKRDLKRDTPEYEDIKHILEEKPRSLEDLDMEDIFRPIEEPAPVAP